MTKFNAYVFLLLVAVLAPVAGHAQRVDPPAEANRAYLTVFTHSDWQQRPQEARLMAALESGKMADLKARTNFRHYTDNEPVYSAGRYYSVPSDEFPVVILSDKDGGYVYKASRTTLPVSGDAIWEQAREAYFQVQEAKAQTTPINISQDCPDGLCPLQPNPPNQPPLDRQPVFPNAPWNVDTPTDDGMSGLFGPNTPVRDSLGYSAWLMGAIVGLFFLSIVFFGFIVIVALALYALKK